MLAFLLCRSRCVELFSGFLVLCVALAGGCSQVSEVAVAEDVAATVPEVQLGQVFCLTTQWYPQTAQGEDQTEQRLLRELVRQGVLITAREDLGMVTRDETLGEPFPSSTDGESDDEVQTDDPPLELHFEIDPSGAWHATLHGAGSTLSSPLWRHSGEVAFNKRTIYSELATQVAAASKEIGDKLRAAGAVGQASQVNPENVPSAEVEALLNEMNFVSQFRAVRAAHRAIAEEGPSREWLAVLVRGYAHLALLTDHTWSSQSDAFAARALLYAERLLETDNKSELSQWHQAYALAVIGAHGAAIDMLDHLQNDRDKSAEELPAWTQIVEPYVKFEQAALADVAVNHAELAETVAFFNWHHYRSYMHGRWIYEKGLEAMEQCPEAYGVYSVMANWSALKIKRLGSRKGMDSFGRLLPRRVATLKDIPDAVKEVAASPVGLFSQFLGRGEVSSFSDRPIKVAKALISATQEDETPTECSWAILGQLIAEEQFVQAADAIVVAGSAVEHSRSPLVERLMPLIEGHRYAAFVESFNASPGEPELLAEIVQGMKVVDPQAKMYPLFLRVWHVPIAEGRNGNYFAFRSVWATKYTHAGLMETYYGLSKNWTSVVSDDHRRAFAEGFREVSPQSPNAIRAASETETFTATQVHEWQAQLGDDPVGWLVLGRCYYSLADLENSERCFQRSIDISPSMQATKELANVYYYTDRKDLWQSTLESYLKLEDLSLSHANVHSMLAEEHIRNRAWRQAEPHALAAARTYSGGGLLLASRVYEGMQSWDRSEHFISEAARSYPSYFTGSEWYFFCRRTGRGNLPTARSFAEQSIEIASRSTFHQEMYRAFVYRLLEGEPEAALQGLEQQLAACPEPESEDTWEKVWRFFHMIAVWGELENREMKEHSLAQLRSWVDQEIAPVRPNWAEVFEGLCRVFEGEAPSEEFLEEFHAALEVSEPAYQCNYWYFLGTALDQLGMTEQAEIYWRKATFGGPFERSNATLAGARLVERHGVDRGGIPEEYVAIEAEVEAQFERDQLEGPEDEQPGDEDRSI